MLELLSKFNSLPDKTEELGVTLAPNDSWKQVFDLVLLVDPS